jgi:pilus assembly protein Flp/PilA
MKSVFVRFVREEEGQDLIEYALLATLVALGAVVGATALGTQLNAWYSGLGTRVGGWATTAAS